MILETAMLDVRPGQEGEFEGAFAEASSIIAPMPGNPSHELHCCIEQDFRYLLLVRWETYG